MALKEMYEAKKEPHNLFYTDNTHIYVLNTHSYTHTYSITQLCLYKWAMKDMIFWCGH